MLIPHVGTEGFVARCLSYAEQKLDHIMGFTKFRALNSLFSMLNQAVRQVQQYNQRHADLPMQHDQLERFILRSLLSGVIWSFSGDGKLKERQELSDFLRGVTTIALPPLDSVPITDFEVGKFL